VNSQGADVNKLGFVLSVFLIVAIDSGHAQNERHFSIVQDVKTKKCRVVVGRVNTNTTQTVLGEFETRSKADTELKHIKVCN